MTEHDEGLSDPSFDRYARLVRHLVDVPVALVSIVEANRQVFPGAVGLPEPYQESRQTPLTHSFCQYVVADEQPLVVADARADERLRDNLAIDDLDVIAYAGWPLTDHAGRTIGSLCAIDGRPRTWTEEELEILADLAAACSAEIAQRELRRIAAAGEERARRLFERGRVLLVLSEGLANTRTLQDVAGTVEDVALKHLDCLRAGLWLTTTRRDAETDTLAFVPTARDDWPQASAAAVVDADGSNPMGEAHRDGVPLFLADRDAQARRYPVVGASRAAGEARAVLPLVSGGQRLGALVLTWPDARDFTDVDRSTAAALATYTAQAVQRARLLEERVATSLVLQNAMLTELPSLSGLDIAARYRPAAAREQVGGDWYDALVLPSGGMGVVIGDVVGHDIEAAADMGQLRSMLRVYAWADDPAPSRTVTGLDRALTGLAMPTLATLVYARLVPTGDGPWRMTWTSAGHPPPVVVHADGTARVLWPANPGTLIGAAPELDRGDDETYLPPGSTLLLYTDGLIERRHEPLATGIERLGAVVARHAARAPEDFLDQVLDELVGARLSDDVAVLAVRVD